MDEAKNTEVKPNGLPARQWFTLQDVATRWTGMTGQAVSVEDVLHYGAEGLLRISCNYRHAVPNILERVATPEGLKYLNRIGLPEKGPFGLNAHDIQRIEDGELFVPNSVLPNTILTYEEADGAVYMLPSFNMSDADKKLDNTLHVERLIVVREEIERFEQTHGLSQPVPVKTKSQIIEESATPAQEESAKPAPAQDDWIARARVLYREYKKDYPRLTQVKLAKKIEPKLLYEGYLGRGKKPLTASNIIRHALQNL